MVVGDIRDQPAVEVTFQDADVVVHLAANTGVPQSVDASRLQSTGWVPERTLKDGLAELLERYGRFEPLRNDSKELSEINLV